jgi:drug/metabolite transporter (DMT)-like permease
MSTRIGTLQCTFGMTVLGASVPVSRLVLDFPDLTGQAGRYALATLVFLGVWWLTGQGFARLGWRDWVRLVALAATGLVAFNVLLLTALRHADPAVVGTVVGGTPLVLALLGPLTRRERPALRLMVAATVVILGGALVHGGGSADTIGLLAAFGTLAGEVLFSLLAVPLLPRLGPLRVSTLSCALAVPMLIVALVVAGEPARWRLPEPAELVGYAYLGGLLTVVAFLAWYGGLSRLGPERAGLFVGLLPPVSLATAAVLDRTMPGAVQVVGVLVVAVGLAVGLGARPLAAFRFARALHVRERGRPERRLRVHAVPVGVGDQAE